jgi:hypothetical protein
MSIFGAILGGALSAIAGNQQADAAKSAARAQERAANKQLKFARNVYEDTTERFQPYYGAGTNALGAYNFELGLGDRPAGYEGYQATPGYDWRMSQGRDAALSAGGGSLSGATLDALQRTGQGIADSDYQGYMNRLAGLLDTGSAAAGNQANAGANFLSAGTNALGNIGNAQAAGRVGAANAWSDAIGNAVGGFGYMSGQQQGGGFGGFNIGNLFGGNSWGA